MQQRGTRVWRGARVELSRQSLAGKGAALVDLRSDRRACSLLHQSNQPNNSLAHLGAPRSGDEGVGCWARSLLMILCFAMLRVTPALCGSDLFTVCSADATPRPRFDASLGSRNAGHGTRSAHVVCDGIVCCVTVPVATCPPWCVRLDRIAPALSLCVDLPSCPREPTLLGPNSPPCPSSSHGPCPLFFLAPLGSRTMPQVDPSTHIVLVSQPTRCGRRFPPPQASRCAHVASHPLSLACTHRRSSEA
jgi:hypothetical protein